MGCVWKYGRSFLVSTRRNNAACSRWFYRVSVSAKDLLTKTTKYTKSVSLASRLARTGGFVRYYLITVRALSHSLFHPAWLASFRVTKNGFRRFVNREMNRPRAANRLVSCYTPFLEAGARDSKIALS